MKKGTFIISLGLLSLLLVAFLANGGEQNRRQQKEVQRQKSERILDCENVRFNRDIPETTFILLVNPTDSIQIDCPDCARYLPTEDNTKGTMSVSIRSKEGTYQLRAEDFKKWIKVRSSNGKIGLVFSRDGFGEKVLMARSLRFWRKTRFPDRDTEGIPKSVLDVNNMYIDKLVKDATEIQTKYAVELRSEDMLTVEVKGMNGATPDNLVCLQYKEKEEWDKTPIEFGTPFQVPTVDGGRDRFFFEFSHIDGIKGLNTYHIDIQRTPARSTGFLDIVEDTTNTDTALAAVEEEEPDPFLKYLELMQGDPDFTCTTPEVKIVETIDARLKLGTVRRNRRCVDLELSDECAAPEDCVGCEALWAFWIGAGKNLINRYSYKDSIRQLKKQEGLIEGWARSRRYRNSQLSSIFPQPELGEDVFFAIVDQADKDLFLTAPLNPRDWQYDSPYTFSNNSFRPSVSYILKFDPARPLSLCMCNDNAVTSVPVMFRYQQFLAEPKEVQQVPVVGPQAVSVN